jgi:putative two-component system response regulator
VALFQAGYLHDIGMVTIPDAIWLKRGLLTDEEWQIIRQHTVRGEAICWPIKALAPVLPIIRSHHERWDGTGYPDGAAGADIPLLARVLQIADYYEALTTSVPYKPAFSHDHAIDIIMEESRRGWRDPQLVDLFAQVASTALDDDFRERLGVVHRRQRRSDQMTGPVFDVASEDVDPSG